MSPQGLELPIDVVDTTAAAPVDIDDLVVEHAVDELVSLVHQPPIGYRT